jgi:hypothetical protein
MYVYLDITATTNKKKDTSLIALIDVYTFPVRFGDVVCITNKRIHEHGD